MFHKDHEITAKNQPRQKTKDIVCVCVHVHVYSLHITGINQQKNIAYTQSFHSALPENFVPFRELHSSLNCFVIDSHPTCILPTILKHPHQISDPLHPAILARDKRNVPCRKVHCIQSYLPPASRQHVVLREQELGDYPSHEISV